MLADRLRVAEVVILLDEAVKQRLLTRTPHLSELQRPNRTQGTARPRSTGRPPAKPAARKSLVAKPKTLAIVDQHLHRGGPLVAEHEHPATERILLEHLLAESGQAVEPADVGGANSINPVTAPRSDPQREAVVCPGGS